MALDPQDILKIQQMIDKAVSNNYDSRRLSVTPTDSRQVPTRQYVQNNGSVLSRPIGSVATIGQFYLATNVGSGQPMWFTNNGWVDGNASVVAAKG